MKYGESNLDQLRWVGIVNLPAIERFIPIDHFTINNKEVKIQEVGDDFKRNFWGKMEPQATEITLRYSKLNEVGSLDRVALLRSGRITETTLANIWQMLKRQPNGEPGKLLTNGYSNIFYIRNNKDVLLAIHVSWWNNCLGHGWYVHSHRVDYSFGWHGSYRVFSRNS